SRTERSLGNREASHVAYRWADSLSKSKDNPCQDPDVCGHRFERASDCVFFEHRSKNVGGGANPPLAVGNLMHRCRGIDMGSGGCSHPMEPFEGRLPGSARDISSPKRLQSRLRIDVEVSVAHAADCECAI